MTPEQALANLDKAVAQTVADRATHNVLNESLRVIADAIKPKPPAEV